VNMDKVDSAIAEELQKFLTDGISAQELAEAVKGALQSLKVRRGNEAELASLLARALYAGRTFAYDADLEKKIAALTPEEVISAFRKHIVPERLVIIRAGDFKKTSAKKSE